jgi:hypothetical protein
MLYYILKIKRSRVWWRVQVFKDGLVSNYSYVMPMLVDWLRDILRGKK